MDFLKNGLEIFRNKALVIIRPIKFYSIGSLPELTLDNIQTLFDISNVLSNEHTFSYEKAKIILDFLKPDENRFPLYHFANRLSRCENFISGYNWKLYVKLTDELEEIFNEITEYLQLGAQ